MVEHVSKIHEKKKNEGRLEGEFGDNGVLSLSPPTPRFPGVQLNSLPTYHRALLSERLEQANSIAYLQ